MSLTETLFAAVLAAGASFSAVAQSHAPGQLHPPSHGGHAGAPSATPYAGLQQREIKALSEQQIADLRAGKGMSLALPAELNGYPGPAHVLALADRLELSTAQRVATQALFERMQAQARGLGEQLIDAERELDRLFAQRVADRARLAAATERAALAHGRLREAHLAYHLEMMDVLSAEQLARYQRLRGY